MKKTEYACRHSDFIIAASGQTRQDIIDYYKIPGEKIHVIYPGSEPMFYAETVTGSNGYFKPARPYIISIGAITPRKNLHKTVEAFHRVMDRHGLDLVVIGTAVGLGKKYLKEIKEFIEKNGMAERVHFLGNVPYKYAPDLCRKAQMMIYPSRFEGFGMPIVEGLFSKIPVITSKGGCFPEAGGEGSVYIDPDNVGEISGWIEKLMESEQLRAEIIDKGTRHARRFRQDRIEQDISDFHQLVIRQSLLNS